MKNGTRWILVLAVTAAGLIGGGAAAGSVDGDEITDYGYTVNSHEESGEESGDVDGVNPDKGTQDGNEDDKGSDSSDTADDDSSDANDTDGPGDDEDD